MDCGGTVVVHPYTLPDTPELFAVAVAYRTQGKRIVECHDCGSLNCPPPDHTEVFIRFDGGPTETDVIKGMVTYVQKKRPTRIVTLTDSVRSVVCNRGRNPSSTCAVPDGGSGDGIALIFDLPEFTSVSRVMNEWTGKQISTAIEAYREVDINFSYPLLRRSLITHSEIRDIGEKIVENPASCEIKTVEEFAEEEVRCLLEVLDHVEYDQR